MSAAVYRSPKKLWRSIFNLRLKGYVDRRQALVERVATPAFSERSIRSELKYGSSGGRQAGRATPLYGSSGGRPAGRATPIYGSTSGRGNQLYGGGRTGRSTPLYGSKLDVYRD
jgi:hypothetical protein